MKALLTAFIFLLASCSFIQEQPQPPQPPSAQAIQEGIGETVERHLIARYNDTRSNCGATSQPAFLCNGIIIRATHYSPNYYPWDNSLESHRLGAVSFSYLRKDSRYSKLAFGYVNGYIFLPVLYANGKLTPEVLCAFPIDAGTSGRTGTGCGYTPAYPVTSRPCQSQGITNAAGWRNTYIGNEPRRSQCGFDVSDALNDAATTAFTATLQAMQLIAPASFATQNELRLAVWPDGQGRNVPMEAFFYVNDSAEGRLGAQKDQKDFKSVTGLSVPVISIWLPKTIGADATFKYLPSDQAISLP